MTATRKTTKSKTTTRKSATAARASGAPKSTPKSTAERAAHQTAEKMESYMTKGQNQFEKLAGEVGNSGKEQFEAFIKAGNIFMQGFEDVSKTCMGWTQTSVEQNTQALKELMSCKTINEFAEAQNKWVQKNFDDFMTGTAKLSELSVKIATDAFEPINDQLSKSIKKATEAVAA